MVGNLLKPALLMAVVIACAACDAIQPIPADADTVRVVEGALFEGGYGTDWHKKIAAEYSALHHAGNVRVAIWGDQRVDDIIKPRLLRGDPPELILSAGLPIWRLISNGKLHSFSEALAEPAVGSDAPWGELFIRGTLENYRSEGEVYAIPTAFGAWSCWYNARLFREKGWKIPQTWREFNDVCDQIKADGIAPLAFQGKYPLYAWWTYISLVHRVGGLAAINRINAVEPGCFSHPDAVEAARLWQEAAQRHFQRGAFAMTHTESQLQFVRGQAAFLFCGIWLENEMKESIPPDFELRCFNMPAVEGGKGNPALFNGEGTEFMFVPADSNFPELGVDFCKYMVSPKNAPDMGASIGVISPIRGGTPRDSVSPALQSVLDMMDEAPGVFGVRLVSLLQRWAQGPLLEALSQLMQGKVTPEEFGRMMDRGLDIERNDPDVIIPPYTQFDPAQFGEPA